VAADGADVVSTELDLADLRGGRVTTIVAGGRALCLTRTEDGWGVVDNRCPHQGGLEVALPAVEDGPSLVEIQASSRDVEPPQISPSRRRARPGTR
jgi:hypothetical protein